MNRLKKKAWGDFIRMSVTMTLLLLAFGLIIYLNIEGGIKHLLTASVSSGFIIAITLFAKLRAGEKDVQSYLKFDEREFYLFRKSQEWGHYCFIGFVAVAIMCVFATVGSRGAVPVWYLPLILCSGIFLSEAVRFIILLNYTSEDNTQTEGGDV